MVAEAPRGAAQDAVVLDDAAAPGAAHAHDARAAWREDAASPADARWASQDAVAAAWREGAAHAAPARPAVAPLGGRRPSHGEAGSAEAAAAEAAAGLGQAIARDVHARMEASLMAFQRDVFRKLEDVSRKHSRLVWHVMGSLPDPDACREGREVPGVSEDSAPVGAGGQGLGDAGPEEPKTQSAPAGILSLGYRRRRWAQARQKMSLVRTRSLLKSRGLPAEAGPAARGEDRLAHGEERRRTRAAGRGGTPEGPAREVLDAPGVVCCAPLVPEAAPEEALGQRLGAERAPSSASTGALEKEPSSTGALPASPTRETLESQALEPVSKRGSRRTSTAEAAQLEVTILGASGLRKADLVTASDPYCVCQVPGSAAVEPVRTGAVFNTLAPEWNFGPFLVEAQHVMGSALEFKVVDQDWGQDDPLGSALLPFEKLWPGGFSGELQLEGEGAIPGATLAIRVAVVQRSTRGLKHYLLREQTAEQDKTGWHQAMLDSGARKKAATSYLLPDMTGRPGTLLHRVGRHPAYTWVRMLLCTGDFVFTCLESQLAIDWSKGGEADDGVPDPTWKVCVLYLMLFATAFDVMVGISERKRDKPWLNFNISVVVTYFLEIVACHAQPGERSKASFRIFVTIVGRMRVFHVLQLAECTPRRFADNTQTFTMIMSSLRGTLRTATCIILMVGVLFGWFTLVLAEAALGHIISNGQASDVTWDGPTSDTVSLVAQRFVTIPGLLVALVQAVSGGLDWADIYADARSLGYVYQALLVFFITYCLIAVMNVVTAAFVEKIMQVSRNNKHMLVQAELNSKAEFVGNMERLFEKTDVRKDGSITLTDMQSIMKDEQESAYLAALGVEVSQVRRLFLLLDKDGSETISRKEFLEGCLRLRGFAKGIDVAALDMHLDILEDNLDVVFETVQERVQALQEEIEQRLSALPHGTGSASVHAAAHGASGASVRGAGTRSQPLPRGHSSSEHGRRPPRPPLEQPTSDTVEEILR